MFNTIDHLKSIWLSSLLHAHASIPSTSVAGKLFNNLQYSTIFQLCPIHALMIHAEFFDEGGSPVNNIDIKIIIITITVIITIIILYLQRLVHRLHPLLVVRLVLGTGASLVYPKIITK